MEDYANYCLKYTIVPSGFIWYGTANYTQRQAEEMASQFNAGMSDTWVTVVKIEEREKAQEDKK